MALGAIAHSQATIAAAVTGIAGPEGGRADKPVGLVHFGLAIRDGSVRTVEHRFGNIGRGAVRLAAVEVALGLIESGLSLVPQARIEEAR